MSDLTKTLERLEGTDSPFGMVGRSRPWCYADVLERIADRLDIIAELLVRREMREGRPVTASSLASIFNQGRPLPQPEEQKRINKEFNDMFDRLSQERAHPTPPPAEPQNDTSVSETESAAAKECEHECPRPDCRDPSRTRHTPFYVKNQWWCPMCEKWFIPDCEVCRIPEPPEGK